MRALYASGKYLYVGSNNTFTIVDTANPAALSVVSSVSVSGIATQVTVQGRYAYVLTDGGGGNGDLYAIDVSDPARPAVVGVYGGFTGGASATGLAVRGRYVYVSNTAANVLDVMDVSDATNPVVTSTIAVTSPGELTLVGRDLYVATNNSLISLFDVQNATAPVLLTTFASSLTKPYSIAVSGKYGYVVSETSLNPALHVYDLSGIEVSGLTAHSADVGSLQVDQNIQVGNQVSVEGGLAVGAGGITSGGALNVYATDTTSTFSGPITDDAGSFNPNTLVSITNRAQPRSSYPSDWGAYINSLLVGSNQSATGTQNYSMVLQYSSSTISSGLCINGENASTCPLLGFSTSLVASGPVVANAFDLAEMYAPQGDVSPGDVLVYGDTPDSVKTSTGIAYDAHMMGVASTHPGFVLGAINGTAVALTGRVPVKFSPLNGAVAIGDPLTSAPIPGYAMKATQPGMDLGYALATADATSSIEMFIKVGYVANGVLSNDGSHATVTSDLIAEPTSTASAAQPDVNSWGLTFRGSAWNGSSALTNDFTFANDVVSATSSLFTIKDASSTTLLSLDQSGDLQIRNDLVVGGRLYPSARGIAQKNAYIFVDDSAGPTSTYMATNAAGWQASDSYDFAEQYPSSQQLGPGDVVVLADHSPFTIERAFDPHAMAMGVISTRPGFIAGAFSTSTYPVALIGRVPTHVSTQTNAIHTGDLLAPSTIAGVAVKATTAGPVIGQALEDVDVSSKIVSINVFVNPTWWGGPQANTSPATQQVATVPSPTPTPLPSSDVVGEARAFAGATQVRVSFGSMSAYPQVQATPQAEVTGAWWIDQQNDKGFEIVLSEPQMHDVTFSWRATPTLDRERLSLSDGTFALINPQTGDLLSTTRSTSTADLVQPVDQGASTSTSNVIPITTTSSTTSGVAATSSELLTPTTLVVPTVTSTEAAVSPTVVSTSTSAAIFPAFTFSTSTSSVSSGSSSTGESR